MTDDMKIKLLVVDDEQSIRRLCMTIGTSLGFVCDEAESAETAATRLRQTRPMWCSPISSCPISPAWSF